LILPPIGCFVHIEEKRIYDEIEKEAKELFRK